MSVFEGILHFFGSNKDAFIAAGVVISSFTTLFVSLMVSSRAHRSSVGQMRQAWIESLRSEIAEVTSLYIIRMRARNSSSGDAMEALQRIRVLRSKIRLSLNPNIAAHRKLEEAVIIYIDALQDLESDYEANEEYDRLMLAARDVFENTWKKIERGQF